MHWRYGCPWRYRRPRQCICPWRYGCSQWYRCMHPLLLMHLRCSHRREDACRSVHLQACLNRRRRRRDSPSCRSPCCRRSPLGKRCTCHQQCRLLCLSSSCTSRSPPGQSDGHTPSCAERPTSSILLRAPEQSCQTPRQTCCGMLPPKTRTVIPTRCRRKPYRRQHPIDPPAKPHGSARGQPSAAL